MNQFLRHIIDAFHQQIASKFIEILLERFSHQQIEAFCIGAIFMFIITYLERTIL